MYLVVKESLLHAIIGADLLQDVPSKLFVELPCQEGHNDCGDGEDSRDGNQERPDLVPNTRLSGGVCLHDILQDHEIKG